MKKKYMVWNIVHNVPGVYDGNGQPELFRTPTAAWKDIADDLSSELCEFICGTRKLRDTSFSARQKVVPVIKYPSGEIWIVDEKGKRERLVWDNQSEA